MKLFFVVFTSVAVGSHFATAFKCQADAAPPGTPHKRAGSVAPEGNPRQIAVLIGHGKPIVCLAFSPGADTLVSVGEDGARLWDTATGKTTARSPANLGEIVSGACAPNGRTLALGGDGSITVWEPATGKTAKLQGHADSVRSLSFSADGNTLVSAAADNAVKVWDVAARRTIRTMEEESVLSAACSPDGKTLATGSQAGEIKLWDVATGKNVATLKWKGYIDALAFSPNGKTLASLNGCFCAVRLWDLPSRKAAATLKVDLFTAYDASFGRDMAFGPDGKTIAAGGRFVRLWDAATGKTTATLSAHAGLASCVTFSSDGKMLASGSLDGQIKLWDVTECKPAAAKGKPDPPAEPRRATG